MTKKLPRIPKLCRRKNDGRYFVTDPHLKKQVYFNSEDPEAEYEDWRHAYRARLKLLQKPAKPTDLKPGQRVTVAEFCLAYLEHAQIWYRKEGEETSEVGVVRMMVKRVAEIAGDKQANRLRAVDVEAILEHMVGEGLARRTINSLLRRLRTMFRWGVRKEVVTGETLGRILSVPGLRAGRTEAREKAKIKPVDMPRVEATLPHLASVHRAMVLTQLHSGMRPGEVCRMKPPEIDRSAEPWQYRPSKYKTQHHHDEDEELRRLIYLGAKARQVLQPLIDACKQPDKSLFLSRRGRPITVIDYHYYIQQACKRAGVKPWHPNQLRHLAGTLIRQQFGAEAARAYLGHQNLKTTEIYAERDRDALKRIAEQSG